MGKQHEDRCVCLPLVDLLPPTSPSREIWARFLGFESNIGDLASILKVERRRFTAFKDEYEGKETALLVDRYKFMDLYPCSASELKALGYKVCRESVCDRHSLLCLKL